MNRRPGFPQHAAWEVLHWEMAERLGFMRGDAGLRHRGVVLGEVLLWVSRLCHWGGFVGLFVHSDEGGGWPHEMLSILICKWLLRRFSLHILQFILRPTTILFLLILHPEWLFT